MAVLRFLMGRKIIVVLMVFFIFVMGIFAASKLDRELFPAISFDGTQVVIHAGEMSTLEVEERITKPAEQILQNINGIKQINSASSIGVSSIQILAEEGLGEDVFKEIEASMKGLEKQILGIQHLETIQFSTEQPYDFFLVLSDGPLENMTEFAEKVVKPRLESLPEVRGVGLDGMEKKEVIVELNLDQLEKEAITSQQVIQAIQQANLDITVANLEREEGKPSVRWTTSLTSVDDIEKIELLTPTGMIQLQDVANVSEKAVANNSIGWNNGTKDFIFVQVGRSKDVTQVEMAESVRNEIAKIREEGLVDGFQFEELVAQADYVSESIDGVSTNVVFGGLLALVILLLFLRNVRATVIIGLSIPLSILLTFIGMWLFDYSFNLLTLIGLGLGIGMMVDSSIVILESIYRKKEEGFNKFDSVIIGVKEVATAVLASMLTTIVVFVPIGLLGGEMGQFMIILSLIVVITLVSSVLVAFTLIPTLSENFLTFKKNKEEKEGRIVALYGRMVKWVTRKKRNRYGIIALFFLIFVSSMLFVTKIPMTVMPDVLNRYAEVMVQLEEGVTPEEREELAGEINDRLLAITDVETNLIMDNVDYFYVLINMTKGEQVTLDQSGVNERINSSLRELQADYPIQSVGGADLSGGPGLPVVIEIKGSDLSRLMDIASNMETELSSVDGLVGITSSANKQLTEQVIVLNERRMSDDGVSALQLYTQMEEWSARIPAGELQGTDSSSAPIFVTTDVNIMNEQDFLTQKIDTLDGKKELSTYVRFEQRQVPAKISRKDGERMISVFADIEGRDLGSINREVEELLLNYSVPAGYTVASGGSLQEQREAMQDMIMILGIAIFLVYVVMAVQFNSFVHPIIVMSIIPLTATGAFYGLLVTQSELSVMSGMGMIFLIGIVLNNAILLIDRTKQLRGKGYDAKEALIEAGKNRLRPIFMTTLTTCGGMLPLAISTGSASNYQSPLAIVIISGLLFATCITLLLIPSIYLLFEDMKKGIKNIRNRLFKRKKQQVKAA